MVDQLVSMGHRDFAYVGGPAISRIAADRQKSVREALSDHSLLVNDDWICPGSWEDPAIVNPIVTRILADLSRRPSVLMCGSDWIAMMAFRAIREAGLFVPTDISVVGFADMSGSFLTDPSLTTVRQPFEAMGGIAVRQLMDAGGMCTSKQQVVIKVPTEIIWRESTSMGPFRLN